MDTECKKFVEALGIVGFDSRTVELLALGKSWHPMVVEEETANMSMAVEGDHQRTVDGKSASISGESEIYSVTEAIDYPVLIDFEKICNWDHDGDLKVGIRMEDPDYMKKRLLEWVHAVAAYVRFLHASADIT